MAAPIIVFLHDARYDRVYQAVSLVATAARMDRAAYLCLFYDALASFVAGTWDDPQAPRTAEDTAPGRAALLCNFARSGGPAPGEILADARAAGARLFACSTSLRMLDLDPADVAPRVDAIVGLATMLEAAGDGAVALYL